MLQGEAEMNKTSTYLKQRDLFLVCNGDNRNSTVNARDDIDIPFHVHGNCDCLVAVERAKILENERQAMINLIS